METLDTKYYLPFMRLFCGGTCMRTRKGCIGRYFGHVGPAARYFPDTGRTQHVSLIKFFSYDSMYFVFIITHRVKEEAEVIPRFRKYTSWKR